MSYHLMKLNIIRNDREIGRKGGVAIAITNQLNYEELLINPNQPTQSVGIKIKLNDEELVIISVYSPPNSQLNLDFLKEHIKYNTKTIVLGDFNACSPSWYCPNYNKSGHVMESFIEEGNLTIKNKPIPTYKHSNNILDLILSTPNISDRITELSITDKIDSDHFALNFELSTSTKKTIAQNTRSLLQLMKKQATLPT